MADPQNQAPTPPQPPRVIFTDPNTPNMVGRQGSVLRERDNGLLEIQYDGLPGTYLTGRALVTVAGDTAAAPARVPQQSVVQSITDDVIADAFMAAQSRQRVPGEYEVYRGENGMGAVRPYTPPPEPSFMGQAVEMAGDIGQGVLRGVNEGVTNVANVAGRIVGIPGTDYNLWNLSNWLTENIGGGFDVQAPEGAAGNIAQGFAEYIPQLVVGYGGAGAAAKAIGGLSSWLQGTAAGAIADFLADPTDPTLGDLAVEIGEMDNATAEAVRQAFAETLAREEGDSEFEARMKQVGGGLLAGAVIDGLIATYRGVRAARTAVPELYNDFMDRMSMQLSSVSPAEARARPRAGGDAIPPGPPGSIDVFHGTPHRLAPEPGFPNGRLRLDKIGTGEGAQVYGWGAYVGEARAVGEHYRETLRAGHDFSARSEAATALENADGDYWKALETLTDAYNKTLQGRGRDTPQVVHERYREASQLLLRQEPLLGTLYHMRIPPGVDRNMLDWDARMDAQPQVVKAAFADLGVEAGDGGEAYKALAKKLRGDKAASEALAERGVPGTRYFDAGSRDEGEGSRNFVIWDQPTLDRVEVIEVDGKPAKRDRGNGS